MASHTVVRAKHATLTGSTVDTITLTGRTAKVEVLNRGTSDPISFTVNGDTPTALGDDTYVVLPGQAVTVDTIADDVADIHPVKLISAGAMAYSVSA